MCFSLFVGTSRPLLRKDWDQERPDISVRSLEGDEIDITAHFSKPEVQYIGSTSNCGCDFPNAMFQNGGWPEIEFRQVDEEQQQSDQCNREGLVRLLQPFEEESVEFYCVWAGDYKRPPAARESIPLRRILEPDFCFKERGFYEVRLSDEVA
jgi:hypothetical protein